MLPIIKSLFFYFITVYDVIYKSFYSVNISWCIKILRRIYFKCVIRLDVSVFHLIVTGYRTLYHPSLSLPIPHSPKKNPITFKRC